MHRKPNVAAKLKALYDKHAGLRKNKSRRTDRQERLEQDFNSLLKNLFYVSHADCEKIIKKYFQDQRANWKLAMGEEDLDFRAREKQKTKKAN